MKFNTNFKKNAAILIGNLLDHYDFYIYTLLAPYIAHVFFISDSMLISLIKAYGIVHVSIITRPLGAAFFGRFAGSIGPIKALRYCLIGVACSTFLIGILPGYNQLGSLAAILLLILRAFQSFCSSGEGAIAGLYILSGNPKRRSFFGSMYGFSTLLGMLMASKICEIVSQSSNPDLYWRLAFILGFTTSLVGIYIRTTKYQLANYTAQTQQNVSTIIKINYSKIIRIAILSAFSYISAPICFVIINALVPLLQHVTISKMIVLNTYLLMFDGIMIIVSGYILSFVKIEKFLLYCSFLVLISQIVLLWIIPFASLQSIMIIRIMLITFGVPFAIALKIWLANITDTQGQEKYFITALGTGMGIEILGRTIIVGAFYIFGLYKNFTVLIAYVICLYLAAIYCLLSYPTNLHNLKK